MAPPPPAETPPPTPPSPVNAKIEVKTSPARQIRGLTLPALADLMESVRRNKRRESNMTPDGEFYGPPRPPALVPCPSLFESSSSDDATDPPMTPREGDGDRDGDGNGDTYSRPMTPDEEGCRSHQPKNPTDTEIDNAFKVYYNQDDSFDDLLVAQQLATLAWSEAANEGSADTADQLSDRYYDTEDAVRLKYSQTVQLMNDLSQYHSEHALVEARFEVMREQWMEKEAKLQEEINQLRGSEQDQREAMLAAIREKIEAECCRDQAIDSEKGAVEQARACGFERDEAVREQVGLKKQADRLIEANQRLSKDIQWAKRDRDAAFKERDSAIVDRDGAISKYDGVLLERDELVQEKDGLMKRLKPLEERSAEIRKMMHKVATTKKRRLEKV